MKHEVFTLSGDEMQIFENWPFTIITDKDGLELAYIRCQYCDDSKCDVIYCSKSLYKYANWTFEQLQRWVCSYCLNILQRHIDSIQHTEHIMLSSFGISDFAYGVNHLQKLTR